MTIYLQVKKTVAVKVRGSAKIGSIKSVFYETEGIRENNQKLFFRGDQLKDDQTLVDYGIREGNTLHLVLQNNVSVKLLVDVPSKSKSIAIEAKTYFSIGSIKYLISEKEGIEPNRFNLVYAGRMLEDSRTLSSLEMPDELIKLQLVFNPLDIISFSVITPEGRTVNLNLKVLYSVSDVKAILGGLIGTSASDYGLIYQGKQLDESKSLAFFDVQEGSVLEISYLKFQIFVKAWSGKTITLDVQQSDTVGAVTNKACNKLGLPNGFQGMLFGGKFLELQHDLAYYNITKHSTLHMVLSPSTMKVKLSRIGSDELGVPNLDTTIHALKAMIMKKFSYSVNEVYFGDKLLRDDLTTGHYKIGPNDSVTFVCDKSVKINEECYR